MFSVLLLQNKSYQALIGIKEIRLNEKPKKNYTQLFQQSGDSCYIVVSDEFLLTVSFPPPLPLCHDTSMCRSLLLYVPDGDNLRQIIVG